MGNLPVITGKELVHILCRAGFRIDRKKGSHVILERSGPQGVHTQIPVHGSKAIGRGLLAAILRDIGMTADELRRLL
jgi:predicted RNA binding protein YcfA (HicA-like mRNA interferase family)